MKIPRWLWWKKYLDTGVTLMNYPKILLLLFGLSANDWKLVMFVGLCYGVACFVVGYFWISSKIIDRENEINNILNPFQRDVRRRLRGKK